MAPRVASVGNLGCLHEIYMHIGESFQHYESVHELFKKNIGFRVIPHQVGIC